MNRPTPARTAAVALAAAALGLALGAMIGDDSAGGAQTPPDCRPTASDDGSAVTVPDGCDGMTLVVYGPAPGASWECIDPARTSCVFLPQTRSAVDSTVPLELPVPCGWWQADVTTDPAGAAATINAGWFMPGFVAGVSGTRECDPPPAVAVQLAPGTAPTYTG